jgi:tetratricopeptide (TPR) repeat protein
MKSVRSSVTSSKHLGHMIAIFMLGIGSSASWHYWKQGRLVSRAEPVTIDGQLFDASMQEASSLYEHDNLDEAIARYRELLYPDDRFAVAHLRMALVLLKKKDYDQASIYAQQALAFNQGLIAGYLVMGQIAAAQDKPDQAVAWYQRAIEKHPTYANAYHHLATQLFQQKKYAQALPYAHKAYELDASNVYHALNLGYLYNYAGTFEQALHYYQKALALKPDLANVHYNIGNTLKNDNQPQAAIPYLEKAVELQPHYPDAHVALAHCYWFLGDFKKAWQEYAWRWSLLNIDHISFNQKMWDGASSLQGKTMLLFSEQGLGDTLQFIRYAQQLKYQGARVVCKVQGPLKTLLSSCPYIDEIITKKEEVPHDAFAALMSLPGILGTTPETIPVPIPYIYADKKLVALWKQRMAQDKNVKIGICWEVEPQHELTKFPSGYRSIPLALFEQLAHVSGVSFYSLQKFASEDQLKHLPRGFTITTFGKDFDESHGRFMDTAALIENLDVVISADTSVIHVAGALGKPVWVLLPYSADCRWGITETTSPWYPSMRLFRAPKPGDWQTPMQEIKKELVKLKKA